MSFFDNTHAGSRARRSTTRLGSLRSRVARNWALCLLFVGIVADATTTAVGINQMGLAVEAGPLASSIIEPAWLGTPWALHEVAAAYAVLEVAVGLLVIGAAHAVRRYLEAVPGGRWFVPALGSVFVGSALVNLRVMLWWAANIPNGGLL